MCYDKVVYKYYHLNFLFL